MPPDRTGAVWHDDIKILFPLAFRMNCLHVCALQCAARDISAADAALLVSADDAARKISSGAAPAIRGGSTSSCSPHKAHNLGPRGFGGRSSSFECCHYSATRAVTFSSDSYFDHHEHRTKTRRSTFRTRERILFTPGFRFRGATLSRRSKTGAGG